MKKALIVDDSPYNRSVLSAILRRRGLEVETAEDGSAGVQKFNSFSPDVVFIDYVMPKMNGAEVVRQIRKTDQKVIIIMVTSISASEEVVAAKEAGANAYVLKPFSPDKIFEAMKKFNLDV